MVVVLDFGDDILDVKKSGNILGGKGWEEREGQGEGDGERDRCSMSSMHKCRMQSK